MSVITCKGSLKTKLIISLGGGIGGALIDLETLSFVMNQERVK